ncbi:MAG: hypothetical protein ACYS47_18730 [Planctomycetota bacterium]|jgi:hypothetical protein
MESEKERIQKELKVWGEKYLYWSKVNMILGGICVISPLLISHVFNKINGLSLLFGYLSAAAGFGLVVLIPGARAAGYVMGIQRVKNALLGFKEGKVSEEGLKRAFRYENATLHPPSEGAGRPERRKGGEEEGEKGE